MSNFSNLFFNLKYIYFYYSSKYEVNYVKFCDDIDDLTDLNKPDIMP